MIVLCYWKLLEASGLKKFKFEGGLNGFWKIKEKGEKMREMCCCLDDFWSEFRPPSLSSVKGVIYNDKLGLDWIELESKKRVV